MNNCVWSGELSRVKRLLIRIVSKTSAIENRVRGFKEVNPQSPDFTIGRIKVVSPTIVKTDPTLSILIGLRISSDPSFV